MSKRALVAGIACLASATMVDAKSTEEVADSERQQKKTITHHPPADLHPHSGVALLVDILKTRMS